MALGTSLEAAWGRGHPGSAVKGCQAGYRSYAGGGNARARNFLGGGPADQNNSKYFWVVLFLCLILTLIDGEAAGDESGFSVALSADGGRLAVGAPSNDGTGADSGHARVYDVC